MGIVISTNSKKLDIDFIHEFLTNSYWAKGRTKEEVIISIENSMNFGIYNNDSQIGFARVLTDYVVFGYLMDVFIRISQKRICHTTYGSYYGASQFTTY